MAKRDVFRAAAGFLALSLVWGTQFLIIRHGQLEMPALLTLALRFAVLAGAGATAARITGAVAPSQTFVPRALFGLAQAVSFGLLYVAQKSLDSGLAGLLSSMTPLFVAILAHLFVRGERTQPLVVLALLFGCGGAAMLVISSKRWESPMMTLAMLLVLFGELAGAANKVLGKNLVARVPSSILLRDMGLTVAIVTGLGWLAFERDAPVVLSVRAISAFLYLGLVASFGGSALYMRLLRRLPLTTLAYLQFATALVATATGILIGGEHFSTGMAFGGAAILGGLALLAWGGRHTPRASGPKPLS